MHSDEELNWLIKLYEKIEDVEINRTLFLLLSELYKNPKLEVQPASRSKFIEVKPLFLGEKYFAFNSSKYKLRWWFTKLAFHHEIVDHDEVLQLFPWAEKVNNDEEIAIDIKGTGEARKVLNFLDQVVARNS